MLSTQDMHNAIQTQFKRFKTEKTSREERLKFTEDITEQYFADRGEMPASSILERLATLLLQEELTDNASNKMRANEFPVLSDNQYRRRTEGRHAGRLDKNGNLKPLSREVPLGLAENMASDGRNYSYPTRRNIDVVEQLDIEYYGKGVDGRAN